MPKIIGISDTHYGVTTDGIDNSLTGLNSRTEDSLQALDQVVDYAIANDVKLVLHSGDVFDSKTVNQNVVNAFAERIKKLSDNGIWTYILAGNHDNSQLMIRKSGLDLFKTLSVDKIFVTRGSELLDLGWVQIASVSYWHSPEEIAGAVDEMAFQVDWNRPAILLVHLQIEYAQFPGSFKEDLPFVPLSALTRHPWVFVQAGHIHKEQILSKEPLVFYAGSLTRHSFAEEKDPKGFWLSEINGKEIILPKQIEVDCLKMLTLKGTMADIRAALKKAKPEYFSNTIVRVIIDTTDEDIDDSFLKTMFSQTFKTRISKEPRTKEYKKIDTAELINMTQYVEKYFEKDPKKIELINLFEEIKKIEETSGLKI